eukprot:1035143-Pleurochrysis_carterae.AAC.1
MTQEREVGTLQEQNAGWAVSKWCLWPSNSLRAIEEKQRALRHKRRRKTVAVHVQPLVLTI